MDYLAMDLTDDDIYQQAAAVAGVQMEPDYEHLYRHLVALAPYQLYVADPAERTSFHDSQGRLDEAVTIGRALHQAGGTRLMKAVAYRVALRGHVEIHYYDALCKCWWNIGGFGQSIQIGEDPQD